MLSSNLSKLKRDFKLKTTGVQNALLRDPCFDNVMGVLFIYLFLSWNYFPVSAWLKIFYSIIIFYS